LIFLGAKKIPAAVLAAAGKNPAGMGNFPHNAKEEVIFR